MRAPIGSLVLSPRAAMYTAENRGMFSRRTNALASPDLSISSVFFFSLLTIILYVRCSDNPIPGDATGTFLVFFCALAILIPYLQSCSPSRLDQVATIFAVDALPGSCVWSHPLILLLASPRSPPFISPPFISPPSMSRRLTTPSTRGVHCLVHVASLPYLYRLALPL